MARLVRAIHVFLPCNAAKTWTARINRAVTKRVSRRNEPSVIQRLIEIVPIGIELVNEAHLPCAWPFLDPRFPGNRVLDFLVALHENQPLEAIAFREPLIGSIMMFGSAAANVRRDADIERAVPSVGNNIDPAAFHLPMMRGAAGKRKTWMARTSRAMTKWGENESPK